MVSSIVNFRSTYRYLIFLSKIVETLNKFSLGKNNILPRTITRHFRNGQLEMYFS